MRFFSLLLVRKCSTSTHALFLEPASPSPVISPRLELAHSHLVGRKADRPAAGHRLPEQAQAYMLVVQCDRNSIVSNLGALEFLGRRVRLLLAVFGLRNPRLVVF